MSENTTKNITILNKKGDPITSEKELREDAGLDYYSWSYFKRIDQGLSGNNRQAEIFDKLGYKEALIALKDPVVSTAFYLSIFPTLKKKIVFEPILEGKKSDKKKSKEIADFLTASLDEVENSTEKKLLFNMLIMKWLGTCYIEKVYDVLPTGPYKSFYYYRLLKARRNGLWDFEYDGNSNVIGFKSLVTKKVWSKKKFISLSYLELFDNPNGNGDFEKIWKFWDAKVNYLIFLLELGARQAKGRQVVLYGTGQGKGNETDHEKVLQDLQKKLAVYLPEGYKVDFSNFPTSVLNDFISVIKELDSQITRAILGSNLSMNESSNGVGSHALSKTHQENSVLFQDYVEGIITEGIDKQYAKDLIELNYDTNIYPKEIHPKCKLVTPENKNLLELVTVFKELKDMGFLDPDTEVDQAYIRELFNLPENPELFLNLEAKKEEKEVMKGEDPTADDNEDPTSDSELYQ